MDTIVVNIFDYRDLTIVGVYFLATLFRIWGRFDPVSSGSKAFGVHARLRKIVDIFGIFEISLKFFIENRDNLSKISKYFEDFRNFKDFSEAHIDNKNSEKILGHV